MGCGAIKEFEINIILLYIEEITTQSFLITYKGKGPGKKKQNIYMFS